MNTVVEKGSGLRGPTFGSPGFVNGNEAHNSLIDNNQIGGGGSELVDGMSMSPLLSLVCYYIC